MYKSSSFADPGVTNTWTQIPKGLPDSAFQKAATPASEMIQEVPHYVIINNAGTYAFNYDFTGSIGAAVPVSGARGTTACTNCQTAMFSASYTTESVMAANQGNLRLDIQPKAWVNTADGKDRGSVGDVTFIYKGGL